MVVDDHKTEGLTPKEARQAGVSVVYQDLSLSATLDVADNMFLGQELRFGPFVRKRDQRREAARWLNEMGADISPAASLRPSGMRSCKRSKSPRR